MSSKQVLTRDQVPLHLTWDTTVIYPNDDAFEAAFKACSESVAKAASFKGTLSVSAEALKSALDYRNNLMMQIETLYTYAHLRSDEDTANAFYQGLQSRARSLYAQIAEALSFYDTELLEADEATVRSYLNHPDLAIYRHEFNLLFKRRAHMLSDKEEALMAGASEVLSGGAQTFSILNNADLKFPTIKNESGEDIQLSNGRYVLFLESKNRTVDRRASWRERV